MELIGSVAAVGESEESSHPPMLPALRQLKYNSAVKNENSSHAILIWKQILTFHVVSWIGYNR